MRRFLCCIDQPLIGVSWHQELKRTCSLEGVKWPTGSNKLVCGGVGGRGDARLGGLLGSVEGIASLEGAPGRTPKI